MRMLLASTLLFVATSSFAASGLLAWGDGPVQWIMTREEARAWKAVKTEEEAREFIDLFWARRDPTPGTYANEYRAEHEGLVEYADKHFKEGDRRGALTERGRVIIALGMPTSLGDESKRYEKQGVTGGRADITGGRQLAGRTVFTWSHEDAVKKFNLPSVEVVFIHDRNQGGARRDTMRNDFVNALPVAIERSIKNPELTTAPEWARASVQTKESKLVATMVIEGGVEPAPVTTTTAAVPAPAPSGSGQALRAGADKLTLVKDAFSIDAQSGDDPFRKLAAATKFRNGEELGFVVQLCTGTLVEEPNVGMQVKITGVVNGEKLTMNAPAEELVPDSIKALPGCHLVRGAVPVQDMPAGTYQLSLRLSFEGRQYNLSREFQVE